MAVITHTRYMLIERSNYLPRSLRMAFYIDCTRVCVTYALGCLGSRLRASRASRRSGQLLRIRLADESANLLVVRTSCTREVNLASLASEDANRELWQLRMEGPAEFAIA